MEYSSRRNRVIVDIAVINQRWPVNCLSRFSWHWAKSSRRWWTLCWMAAPGAARQYLAAFAACLSVVVSGSCFGWVTPILTWLLGPHSEIPMTSDQSSWMVAIVELGNLLSPIPASVLADRWGRKPCIMSTGPLYLLSWVLILVWPNLWMIYIARTVQGLSMGIVFTVVPLYISEISHPSIRGSITSLYHNGWYLGHLIEYTLGAFLSYRTYTYITAALPVVFFLLFFWQPESPYFLLMRKREEEAAVALAVLRGRTDVSLHDDELDLMVQTVNEEMSVTMRWKDIIKSTANRKSLEVVIGLGVIRVMNGLIAIMTYSTQTFSHLHPKNLTLSASDQTWVDVIITPEHITILFGFTVFVSSFFPTLVADLAGRRQLLMCSCIGASINLFLAGGYFYLDMQTDINVKKYNWFPVLVLIVFSLFVTLGIGPISVMYQSEMFLSNMRGFASSISAINLTINAFFILKFYQIVADNVGVFFILWLFSAVCLCGTIWVYFIVPETKGKTFSQIREDLNVSIRKKCDKSKQSSSVVPAIEVSDMTL